MYKDIQKVYKDKQKVYKDLRKNYIDIQWGYVDLPQLLFTFSELYISVTILIQKF